VSDFQTNLAWDTLFEPLAGGPKHRRLAEQLREAVRTRRIPPGAALPPSRLLAEELGCSRWVVTEAYGQLVAEGYLEARAGSATRVREIAASQDRVSVLPDRAPRAAGMTRPRHELLPGTPDLGAFPRRAWADAVSRALRTMADAEFSARPRAGHPRLRGVLAEYLRRVRGARVGEDDVVVCRGVTDGIRVVCEALRDSGLRRIGVEEPGWAQVWQAATRAGLECVPIAVDEQGLRVEELFHHQDLRAVVVAPAHQFPTGAVLDPRRRAALLRWAEAVDGVILEDDYDSEFRYDREPVGVLQGVAPDRVVLHGSVSKTLAPALGLGWLAVPDAWRVPVLSRLAPADAPGVPDQVALAGFIESGSYDRELRRARRRYRARRAELIAVLERRVPGVRVSGAEAGLHLVAGFGGEGDPAWSVRVEREAAALGLRVSPLDFHRGSGPSGERALVLGYGDLPEHAVEELVVLLKAAVDAAARGG
jgi:GntR family transcriptional regulator/MocR family aminotransferase